MALYRRRLPHDYETDQPVFLTWRLHDSLPCHRVFPAATVTSGQAFAAVDRLLDEARSGPFYLRRPAIAMTGSYFWQEESYDRLVRNERELEKIQARARRIGAEGE